MKYQITEEDKQRKEKKVRSMGDKTGEETDGKWDSHVLERNGVLGQWVDRRG